MEADFRPGEEKLRQIRKIPFLPGKPGKNRPSMCPESVQRRLKQTQLISLG
jgi:hypothetical protein